MQAVSLSLSATRAAGSRQQAPASARSSRIVASPTTCCHAASVSRRLGLLSSGIALSNIVCSSAMGADPQLTTSSSGIQWGDYTVGEGNAPVKGATIKCHYRGTFLDGRVFDESYGRGRPLSFPVGTGRVIKGWDMAILGSEDIPAMKTGGKRKVVIPPGLAYGERGAGGVIPPNTTLQFDIELLP